MTSEEKVFIVDETSATHGRPHEYKAHHRQALDLDHPSLVRYARNDGNYLMVRSFLEICAEDAQRVVQRRSEQRQALPKASRSGDIMELPSVETFEIDQMNAQQRAPQGESCM